MLHELHGLLQLVEFSVEIVSKENKWSPINCNSIAGLLTQYYQARARLAVDGELAESKVLFEIWEVSSCLRYKFIRSVTVSRVAI